MRTTLPVCFVTCAVLSGCATSATVSPLPTTPAEIATLEARARRDSANAETQLQLAAAYLGQARPRDALPAAQRALARGGLTSSRAALLVGLSQEELGNYGEARECYNLALRSPGSSRLRTQLQQRLMLLQRRETQAYVKAALAKEATLVNAPPRPR